MNILIQDIENAYSSYSIVDNIDENIEINTNNDIIEFFLGVFYAHINIFQ